MQDKILMGEVNKANEKNKRVTQNDKTYTHKPSSLSDKANGERSNSIINSTTVTGNIRNLRFCCLP